MPASKLQGVLVIKQKPLKWLKKAFGATFSTGLKSGANGKRAIDTEVCPAEGSPDPRLRGDMFYIGG